MLIQQKIHDQLAVLKRRAGETHEDARSINTIIFTGGLLSIKRCNGIWHVTNITDV